MNEPLKITVEELRSVCLLLLEHLDDVAKGTCELDVDMFWSIPKEDLYNVYAEPEEFTIGQVSESWEFLGRLLADPDHMVGYGLVWLADVLRAIGLDARLDQVRGEAHQ